MTPDLESIFRARADERWLFVRPGGNWGDALIYAGAECLAKRLGMVCRTMTAEEFRAQEQVEEKYVYLHGGGGLNSWVRSLETCDAVI